ncbi:cytidine deaminase [Curtobacterium pusillum]|uniref:Cytidine deaminase n=1 Tax=Curtobacterium pusillum TaxID=69373 RepID=A0AAW3TAT8_9MICO|nr:cytidine deaminase [Curtobacterium pusillum]MBA8991718.1 cytidine deaminase [Curtobacterium pusillum]
MTDTNAAGDQAVTATPEAEPTPGPTPPVPERRASGGPAVPVGSLQEDVDWTALRTAATAAMRHAYVPYSSFPVGAAALTEDGRIVSGCNVENASFGLTLCAECALVSQLHMTGGGKLVAFACVDGDGATLMPCGRCRQLLFEHSAESMLLETVSGIRTIDEVLPDAFGPRTVAAYRQEH